MELLRIKYFAHFQPEYGSKGPSRANSKPSKSKEKTKSSKRSHSRRQKRGDSKNRKVYYNQESLERSKDFKNRTLENTQGKCNLLNLGISNITKDSSYMLCKNIKNDLKKLGSNKLSKYLKTCKEKTKGKIRHDLKPPSKPSWRKKKIFGNRTGSVDINSHLVPVSNKLKSRKASKVRKISKNSRQNSKCSYNNSLERSLSNNRTMGVQKQIDLKSWTLRNMHQISSHSRIQGGNTDFYSYRPLYTDSSRSKCSQYKLNSTTSSMIEHALKPRLGKKKESVVVLSHRSGEMTKELRNRNRSLKHLGCQE